MRALSLEVRNYCQFPYFQTNFGPGLTAIMGPNGSGKSNLVGAIKFCLTGSFASSGVKDTNIYQFTPDGEQAYARFKFQHGGTEATVTRYLRPSSKASTLQITGQREPIRGDKPINTAIQELLIERSIIDDIVMVDQGAIFGFLAKTSGQRAAAFGKIFQTDFAEQCWKAIGDYSRSAPRMHVPTNVDEVTQTRANLDAQRNRYVSQRGTVDLQKLRERLESLSEECHNFSSANEYRLQAQQVQQDITRLNGQIASLEAVVTEQTENVATLEEAAEKSAEAADNARALLANQRQIQALVQRKELLTSRIDRLKQQLATSPPVKPENYYTGNREALSEEINLVHYEVHFGKQFVNSFKPELGRAECPTCRTPTANLQERLEEARRNLPLQEAHLQSLQNTRIATDSYDSALANYNNERTQLEAQLRHAEADLAALDAESIPQVPDTEALQGVVAEHADYLAALQEYRRLLHDAQVRAGTLRGQVEQLVAQQVRLGGLIGPDQITQEQYNQNLQELASLRKQIDEIEAAERALPEIEAQITLCDERLQLASHATEFNQELDNYLELLQPVRDLLHREAAPRFVAQMNLQRIQRRVNEHLEEFYTDFRVVADEGLSFIARFNDGRQIPAERLSGGQQVVLALAFRLAVNFMYSDLGFLSLDEPTAYLDEHHINGFRPVLERLRNFTSSRGLQCIMVTHEQSLAPLFDAVIQLSYEHATNGPGSYEAAHGP